MMLYLVSVVPLVVLYLLGIKLLVSQVQWAYRGLLLIGFNGLCLSLAFGLGSLLWEAP